MGVKNHRVGGLVCCVKGQYLSQINLGFDICKQTISFSFSPPGSSVKESPELSLKTTFPSSNSTAQMPAATIASGVFSTFSMSFPLFFNRANASECQNLRMVARCNATFPDRPSKRLPLCHTARTSHFRKSPMPRSRPFQ